MAYTTFSGTITGATTPYWKVKLNAKMRTTAEVDPYTQGEGGYTIIGKVSVGIAGTIGIMQDPNLNKNEVASVRLVNESDHDSASTELAVEQARLDAQGNPVHDADGNPIYDPVTLIGATLSFTYTAFAEGDISTTRPEATCKIRSWVQQKYVGSAVAFDGVTPIEIHDVNGFDVTSDFTTLN